jgi:hypothetical protein
MLFLPLDVSDFGRLLAKSTELFDFLFQLKSLLGASIEEVKRTHHLAAGNLLLVLQLLKSTYPEGWAQ